MEQHFSVFNNKGSGDSKPELIEFARVWAWVDFLAAVAETKVFDLPGTGWNSFKCVEETKAFDVFTYASRNKDFSLAMKDAYKT